MMYEYCWSSSTKDEFAERKKEDRWDGCDYVEVEIEECVELIGGSVDVCLVNDDSM
jgi:hypothetical protein